MVKLDLPRGMRDLEPQEYSDISYVREKFFETAKLFNFRLMEPSPLELLSTLEAKSGESISNEIYAFKDKGDREVALRFDLTIGLTRNIAQRRDLKMPAKVASFSGVWRYDEPQAGRYRYFHQWDIEVYGPFSQESDAEVIEFVSSFFNRLGLTVTIEVSDRLLIEEFIRKRLGIAEEDSILELFRALDKVPKKGSEAVIREYSSKIDSQKLRMLIELSEAKGSVKEIASLGGVASLGSWDRLVNLMNSLLARNVNNARINLGIVRGLDYYSGIVFEVFEQSNREGALVGGGRYDRLTEAFGRKDMGATGAAGGVERIVMALHKHGILGEESAHMVYVACASDEMRSDVLKVASALRNAGIATEYDMLSRPLRKQLDDASGKKASAAVIVAPSEYRAGSVIVRSLADGKEETHPVEKLPEALKAKFRA